MLPSLQLIIDEIKASLHQEVEAKAREIALAAGTDEKMKNHALHFATWCVVVGNLTHNPGPDDYRRYQQWLGRDELLDP